MADNQIGERANNGNDWDVVSLTASTYAAAPSFGGYGLNSNDSVMACLGETPRTMFLSDHFVFPPNQHENLPVDPDVAESYEVETADVVDEGSSSGEYDEEIRGFNSVDAHKAKLFDGTIVNDEANQSKKDEDSGQAITSSSDLSNPKVVKHDKLQPDIPHSGTWWTSWYTNAKESNSFWSVFVAATVMGVVIIGQRWQQERWRVLQLKLHLNVGDEKMAGLLGPLTRLKEAVMRSQDRISFLSSAPVEH